MLVGDGLRSLTGDIKRAIGKCKGLASLAHQSSGFAEVLAEHKKSIPVPSVTRWNYQIRTVKAVLDISPSVLKMALAAVSSSRKCTTQMELSAGEISRLNSFVSLLEPLADFTDEAQKDDALICSIVPNVCFIREHLATFETGFSDIFKVFCWFGCKNLLYSISNFS